MLYIMYLLIHSRLVDYSSVLVWRFEWSTFPDRLIDDNFAPDRELDGSAELGKILDDSAVLDRTLDEYIDHI